MPASPLRHQQFHRICALKAQYKVSGMLTLMVNPPYTIALKMGPEIWNIPEGFIKGVKNTPGPISINGVDGEHLDFTHQWLKSELGAHLLELWNQTEKKHHTRELLTTVIHHLAHIGHDLIQMPLPQTPEEARNEWKKHGHPVKKFLEQTGYRQLLQGG